MRIAMLLPMEIGTSSHLYGKIEKVVSLLTNELTVRDVAVVLFSADDLKTKVNIKHKESRGYNQSLTLKALECLHISDAFEQANDFDLIHNHFNFLPLSYSDLVVTPILTTIYEFLPSEILPVYKKYNGRAFYVSDINVKQLPELDYAATIDHNATPPEMVEAYLKVYKYAVERKHREDRRPWGHYTVLSDTPEQRSKLVHVYPGTRLSLQRHKRRHEHWHIVKGEALVTLDGREFKLKAGESIEIPLGAIHRIANNGTQVMSFFEVQTGDYLGEDDIERLEDDYSRHISE